jgi:hypothetical protein
MWGFEPAPQRRTGSQERPTDHWATALSEGVSAPLSLKFHKTKNSVSSSWFNTKSPLGTLVAVQSQTPQMSEFGKLCDQGTSMLSVTKRKFY